MAKIYFIAGEISGDFIGSRIIRHLKNNDEIECIGIGGKSMEEAGLSQSLFSISEISLMGFIEIIPNIFRLKRLINLTVENIINSKPDLLITIDSPGFTYRVAKKLKTALIDCPGSLPNFKMLHIVAPSVWAYKPKRALKYAKIYDGLLALLPFEPPYFTRTGLDCRYIGHPILEQEFYDNKAALRQEFNIADNTKILCVTLGSRKGEVLRHLPVFLPALENIATHKSLVVIFTLASSEHQEIIKPFLTNVKFSYIFSTERLKAYAASDLALAKSGTNTLEIAASNTPMVVAYKLSILSFFIIKALIKIKYVTLINIIAGTEIIPEFIQFKCNSSLIGIKLKELLSNPSELQKQVLENQKILKKLGFKSPESPSSLAAKIIKEEFLSAKNISKIT